MQTVNKADENYKKLAELFPNAVTETIDPTTGEVVRAVDKDVLMQEINTKVVEENEERYQFTWPDKKKSVLLANAPINKTLRPCREESVDFDHTENLYIEGDNLEVLKLLQETYLGKIKMIYIDPPYNTGNDFVYEDDFDQSTEEYLDNSGQFDEEGNVASDSDETLLKNEVGTDYSLDFQGEKAVLLTLLNGGMLQYLNENSETTFVITGYSDSQITAVGQTHGKEMILTPVSTAALQQAKERKRLAIIAYNKAQAMDLLKGELNNGVFRRSSSSFLAHYLIICDESNNWKVKISAIDNGVVKHTEYPMIIDTTNDENAVLTLGSNVTVDGISLNKLYYNYLNGEIETDNANVVCDTRKASDIAAWYANGWKTHIVDQDEIHADFKGIFHSGVEFDDRNPRNLIACPWSGMGSYIGFAVTMTADNATGRIFISLGEPYDLFGWNNNPADYNRVQQDYSKFLSFCVSEDGFYWSYDDNDSMVYVLSATGERWFRMKK